MTTQLTQPLAVIGGTRGVTLLLVHLVVLGIGIIAAWGSLIPAGLTLLDAEVQAALGRVLAYTAVGLALFTTSATITVAMNRTASVSARSRGFTAAVLLFAASCLALVVTLFL